MYIGCSNKAVQILDPFFLMAVYMFTAFSVKNNYYPSISIALFQLLCLFNVVILDPTFAFNIADVFHKQ